MRSKSLLAASLLATAFAFPLASAAHAAIVISIDKSTQRMLVAVDGQTRYEWPVSTGRAGYDTPSGVFKVNRMDADHYSKEYEDAFMPDSMFFDLNGHAIHGFNDVPHLGRAVSHGCVRLSPANAAVLFALVKQQGMANTTVEISGHIPPRGAPLVASRQAPGQEAANEPPSYGQPAPYPSQGYSQQQPYYGQPGYGQQPSPYPPQQAYARPSYGGSAFPPQPAPVYARPYGGQGYYQQPYGGQGYSGQGYSGQGYYDQGYQQPRGYLGGQY
jgi:hypothetical protein